MGKSFEHVFFFCRKKGIKVYNHSGEIFKPPSFIKWESDGSYYCDLSVDVSDLDENIGSQKARFFLSVLWGRYLEQNPNISQQSSNKIIDLFYQRPVFREKSAIKKMFQAVWEGESSPDIVQRGGWFFRELPIPGWMADQMVKFGLEVRSKVERLAAERRAETRRAEHSRAAEMNSHKNLDMTQILTNKDENHNSDFGYVYILKNPAFPHLIKIGYTERENVEERAKEISSSTGVPYPFVVVYKHKTKNARKAEELIHKYFANSRANESREFFDLDSSIVIRYMIAMDELE